MAAAQSDVEVRLARPHDKHAQYVDRNRLLGQTPNDRSGRAAQSDVVRLNVLANHGGVWADATVACMQPLDLWLDAALKPTGFWMYRGDYIGGKRSPCSWFMAAERGSSIACGWRSLGQDYWAARPCGLPSGHAGGLRDYFWLDGAVLALDCALCKALVLGSTALQ